jgi:hypothetical protein
MGAKWPHPPKKSYLRGTLKRPTNTPNTRNGRVITQIKTSKATAGSMINEKHNITFFRIGLEVRFFKFCFRSLARSSGAYKFFYTFVLLPDKRRRPWHQAPGLGLKSKPRGGGSAAPKNKTAPQGGQNGIVPLLIHSPCLPDGPPSVSPLFHTHSVSTYAPLYL